MLVCVVLATVIEEGLPTNLYTWSLRVLCSRDAYFVRECSLLIGCNGGDSAQKPQSARIDEGLLR